MSRAAQRSSRTFAQGWRSAWAVSGTPVWIATGLLVAWSLFARWRWGDDRMWAAFRGGSLVPLAVEAGDWWRLLTAGVLHLDLRHLGVNAAALALIGRLAQRVFGGGRTVLVFAAGSVGGCAASLLTPEGWSLGASGGVFALLGALLSALFRVRHDTPRSWRWHAQRQVLPWALGLGAVTFAQLPQADHLAHLGAFAIGLGLGLFIGVVPIGAARFSRPVWLGLGALSLLGLTAAWAGMRPGKPPPLTTHALGAVTLQAPARWVVGPPLPPCDDSLTDGLRFLCGIRRPAEWSEATVLAEFEAAGYRTEPASASMPGWRVFRLVRGRAERQFGRLCIRQQPEGWVALMLRSPARALHRPHNGCALE